MTLGQLTADWCRTAFCAGPASRTDPYTGDVVDWDEAVARYLSDCDHADIVILMRAEATENGYGLPLR